MICSFCFMAVRVAADWLVDRVRQLEHRQVFIRLHPCAPVAHAVQIGQEGEVFHAGEPFEHLEAVGHEAERPLGLDGVFLQVEVLQRDPPESG